MGVERIIAATLMMASSFVVFACKNKQSPPPPTESSPKRQRAEPTNPTEDLAGGGQKPKTQRGTPERLAKPTDDLGDDRHHEDDTPRRPADQPRRPTRLEEEEE